MEGTSVQVQQRRYEKTMFKRLVAFGSRNAAMMAPLFCGVFLAAGKLTELNDLEPSATFVFVTAYLAGGWRSAVDGVRDLLQRRVDVDLLMVLAAASAAWLGQWFEGGVLLFLFSLSNALQARGLDKARHAIYELVQLRPETAVVLREGKEVEIDVSCIEVGDVCMVKPGDRIPADGIVVSGQSSVDQAVITGESMPVDKGPGDDVFAGTINYQGLIQLEVTRRNDESVLAKVVKLVEQAQAEKAPTQRLVDTVEQYYALAVIALTLVTVPVLMLVGDTWSESVYRALTLMVVASPCAVALSIPSAVITAIARAARLGVLFKGGIHVENAADVRVIAFDKTGTLTYGRPAVMDIVAMEGHDEEEVLHLAASIENGSGHPIAHAVVVKARERGLDLLDVSRLKEVAGHGISATVHGRNIAVGRLDFIATIASVGTEVRSEVERLETEGKTAILVADHRVLGIIAVLDQVRDEAGPTLRAIQDMGGYHTVMLTGDNPRVAAAIAGQIGVDDYMAQLFPDEKASAVKAMTEIHGSVLMVGDGVNDAPALATATLGMAMGAAGTPVALESADVVLMTSKLDAIPLALRLSRKTRRVMMQNLGFALGMIGVLIILTFALHLPLTLGVVGHEGSTLLVILNSLRLLRTV